MAVELSLINAALTRTGNEPITSLSDGSAAGKIATQNYEEMVKGMLGGYPWKWATKTQTLNLITGDPDPPWTYAYQRPTDVLDLRIVMAGGLPITYEVQYDKILCDVGTSIAVIAKYTWRPDEAYWPPWFRDAVIDMLEPLFLRGIGERYAEAEDRERAAARSLALAKLKDSQQQTPREGAPSATLQARRGTGAPWRSLFSYWPVA